MKLTILALLFSASAFAQYQPPPPGGYGTPPPAYTEQPDPFQTHRGLMWGIGIGFSGATCGDCVENTEGLGTDFYIGGFINPRLAIMFDSSTWVRPESDYTLSFNTSTVALQYWVAPRLWIKGGLGLSLAKLQTNFFTYRAEGGGGTAAIGYEVLTSPQSNFVLDLSARISMGRFSDAEDDTITSGSLLFGLRWM